MISKIPVCARIGLISGFFAALLAGAYGEQPFLSNGGVPLPATPVSGLSPSLLGGLVVALIFAAIVAQMHALLFRYPAQPVLIIALITAIPIGLAAGFLAYYIALLWAAALAGAVAGFILGWLVCWILCGRDRLAAILGPGHD